MFDEPIKGFRGPVHLPGSSEYDEQRVTWSGAIDPRPAVVAIAQDADDVRAALVAAREQGLPFAMQSTGHGTHFPCDDGVLVKTSDMVDVSVDPVRRVATVGPGVRWSQVVDAAARYGLVPLCGTSAVVGVAGYTLGGGAGWLSRQYGFAADSLLRVELVSAEGEHVVASADQHPDLFWALRGGGANFGAVTSLEFRLYPVARVYGGSAYFPIDRAAETLAYYREWAATAQPDTLMATFVVRRQSPRPDIDSPVFAIRAVYTEDDGERALRPLLRVAGEPIRYDFGPMEFAETFTIGGTPAREFELLDKVPDALIDVVCQPDSPMNEVEVRYWGGAMANGTTDSGQVGPVGHRQVPFSMTVDGSPDSVAPILPYATGGSFLNLQSDTTRTADAYTPENYRRLRELKRAYDPDNVFGVTHNIPPS